VNIFDSLNLLVGRPGRVVEQICSKNKKGTSVLWPPTCPVVKASPEMGFQPRMGQVLYLEAEEARDSFDRDRLLLR
jgi:hypothetical protein